MASQDSQTNSNGSSNRKSTIDGMALAQAKKMASKIFQEHFVRVEQNIQEDTFDIHIYDTADKRDIDKFKGDKSYRIFFAPNKPIKI